jgi:hypothetical protein
MLLATLFQLAGLAASPLTLEYVAPNDANSELIGKYLNVARLATSARRGVEVEITIAARVPTLSKQATLRTLRSTSETGTIRYTTLEACGDAMVRREVIARYLAAEGEARESDEIAINPSHYKFRFTRTVEQAHRSIDVFQLTPKHRRPGLFKGELWLDSQTGVPVRESGLFVKNPSVFVRRIVFARDFEVQDGIAIPRQIRSTIDTRIVGRAELSIQFSDVVYDEIQNRPQEGRQCQ